MLNNSKSPKNSDFYKASKISFSLEKLLDDFSFWFPKAGDYGFTADEMYAAEENAIVTLIPIPIVEDENYKLWLFYFYKAERVTPRIKEMILAEMNDLLDLSKISYLIHKETVFILADVVRGRITPKFGRKSVYVIKADYAYKVYEIIAKAVEGFVKSFRENVKYGDDLLALCDDLEKFAERMQKRADELKPSSTSPIHHPPVDEFSRKEAEEHIALLEKSRVIK
ncbi:MAG: hypothetical protein DRN09_02035 [Thermoplasmata archaeon]|nr:MAG: hypothetical protein DRN09_02035 [Thermoplasmata archaeon]